MMIDLKVVKVGNLLNDMIPSIRPETTMLNPQINMLEYWQSLKDAASLPLKTNAQDNQVQKINMFENKTLDLKEKI